MSSFRGTALADDQVPVAFFYEHFALAQDA